MHALERREAGHWIGLRGTLRGLVVLHRSQDLCQLADSKVILDAKVMNANGLSDSESFLPSMFVRGPEVTIFWVRFPRGSNLTIV